MQNIVAAGVDILIMALICLSLFSGKPVFETSRAKPAVPMAGTTTR